MYFLDVNWPLIIGPLAYFLVIGGLMDGFFVHVFLQPRKFLFAIGQALLANSVSLVAGFVAWPYIFPTGFDFAELSLASYGLLWLLTMLCEALVLKLFNRRKSWNRVLMASICMNVLSFIILYLFFVMIN